MTLPIATLRRCLLAAFLSVFSAAVAASLDRAENLLQSGDATAARELLQAHLETAPEDSRAMFLMARALGDLGQTIAAIEVYEELIHLYPDVPEAYINLAVHYAGQGEADTARSLLLQAINTQQSCSVAYENLTRIHAGMASQAYRQALAGSGNVVTPIQTALVTVSRLPLSEDPSLLNGVVVADAETRIAAISEPAQDPKISDPADSTPAVEPDAPIQDAVVATAKEPNLEEPARADVPTVPAGEPETDSSAPVVKPVVSTAAPAAGADDATVEVEVSEDTVATVEPAAPDKTLALAPVEPVGIQAKTPEPTAQTESATSNQASAAAPAAEVAVAAVALNPDNGAPITTETQPAADPNELIMQTVSHWSRDWSRQSVGEYLSHYAKDFKPNRGSLTKWKLERAARLKAPSYIKVEISDLQVSLESEQAVATFKQSYRSDNYGDVVTKTLVFALRDGKWRIVREYSRT